MCNIDVLQNSIIHYYLPNQNFTEIEIADHQICWTHVLSFNKIFIQKLTFIFITWVFTFSFLHKFEFSFLNFFVYIQIHTYTQSGIHTYKLLQHLARKKGWINKFLCPLKVTRNISFLNHLNHFDYSILDSILITQISTELQSTSI